MNGSHEAYVKHGLPARSHKPAFHARRPLLALLRSWAYTFCLHISRSDTRGGSDQWLTRYTITINLGII